MEDTMKIHERSLKLICGHQKFSHQNLLEIHEKFSIHQRSLQVLMTEFIKILMAWPHY